MRLNPLKNKKKPGSDIHKALKKYDETGSVMLSRQKSIPWQHFHNFVMVIFAIKLQSYFLNFFIDVYAKTGSAISSTIPNIRIHTSGSFIPAILEPA